jgi:hypothetical protein
VGLAPALTISMPYPLMAAMFAAAFLGEPMWRLAVLYLLTTSTTMFAAGVK